MSKFRTVLFDLDGTLADTAPDLGGALNKVLIEEGRDPLPLSSIRPYASHGSTALVRIGFGVQPGEPRFAPLRERVLLHYAENICTHTQIFPGVSDLLDQLQARGICWGIVTNKPAFLTDPLIARLGLTHRPACVVSGDTTANRKPHPEPILHACTLVRAHPGESLYIGDAERDIQAGREAGMKTLIALYGYLGDHDRPGEWGADGMVHTPLEILDWIDAQETNNVR